MAATYSPSRVTAVDRVRAALGDTEVTPASAALFQDEEIAAVVAAAGSEYLAVGQLASELVVRFARKPVRIVAGNVTVDYSERLGGWQALADRVQQTTLQTGGRTSRTMSIVHEAGW